MYVCMTGQHFSNTYLHDMSSKLCISINNVLWHTDMLMLSYQLEGLQDGVKGKSILDLTRSNCTTSSDVMVWGFFLFDFNYFRPMRNHDQRNIHYTIRNLIVFVGLLKLFQLTAMGALKLSPGCWAFLSDFLRGTVNSAQPYHFLVYQIFSLSGESEARSQRKGTEPQRRPLPSF